MKAGTTSGTTFAAAPRINAGNDLRNQTFERAFTCSTYAHNKTSAHDTLRISNRL